MSFRPFIQAFCGVAILVLAACRQDEKTTAEVPPPEAAETSVANVPDEMIRSGDLAGLYKNAGENTPIVLIIPGSGPTDLNGNNLRVDKRGMFSSAAAGDPNQVTVEIYAQDYSGWVESIRSQTGAECVYILGHSEGALMASAAANMNDNI